MSCYQREFWDMLCTSIAKNESVKHFGLVNVNPYFLVNEEMKGVVEGALSENTLIQSIFIAVNGWLVDVMKVVMMSPKIERLHIVNRYYGVHDLPTGTITEMAEFVHKDKKLNELRIINVLTYAAQTVEFASAFGSNTTIKRLTFGGDKYMCPTWIFAEALPKEHSMKRITFYGGYPDGGYLVSIIKKLAQTHLQELVMVDSQIYRNADIMITIIQKLECTKNNFTNLIISPQNDYSPQTDWFQMAVEQLTWSNFFQGENDMWITRFLKHGDPSKPV